ncbi:MAG: hypothetical protein IIA54_03235 [Chloroflexi bacterium]|nr:hypothetical protein [Chloroflexota bacterium]
MLTIVAGAALFGGSCGAVNITEFPNAVIGSAGQRLLLEDIEAIVSDVTLTDDQKRAGLRDLGLEDEKLIEALLAL